MNFAPPPSEQAGDRAGAPAAEGPHAEHLADALRVAITRELLRSWHFINSSHFRSALTAPTLGLHRSERSLGLWQAATRSILLSERLVLDI